MHAARVTCMLVLVLGLASLCSVQVAAKCNIVQCLIDPCVVTDCQPSNPDWQCVSNYCGGCNTDWKHTKTGLVISTCPPEACTQVFDPVCGVDGVTYSSPCFALVNGVEVAHKGPCDSKPKCDTVACLVDPCAVTTCKPSNPDWQCVANYCGGCNTDWNNTKTGLVISTCPPDVCPEIFKPVCGVDGVTYPNSCFALVNGIKVAYDGECKCPKRIVPVCGADGKSYRNRCLALKNGTTVAYKGLCLLPAQCAKANLVYNPVCDGATGLTWTHRCVADLNNITATTDGACISGPCAKCTATSGCNADHPCKGNPKYTCDIAACITNQILDDGRRVTYSLCSPIYKDKLTGYPAAACYP